MYRPALPMAGWAVLCLLAAGAAHADCLTVDAWRGKIVASSTALVVAAPETIGPALQALVTQAYNAEPPVSKIVRDSVVMLLARDRATGLPLGQAAFGFVKGGCITGMYVVPLPSGKIIDDGEGI